MKRLQDRHPGDFGTDPLGQGDTVRDGLPSSSDPSVGIRMLVYIALSSVPGFLARSGLVFGFGDLRVPGTTETLSSSGPAHLPC